MSGDSSLEVASVGQNSGCDLDSVRTMIGELAKIQAPPALEDGREYLDIF